MTILVINKTAPGILRFPNATSLEFTSSNQYIITYGTGQTQSFSASTYFVVVQEVI